MAYYRVKGAQTLKGEITVSTAKNSAVSFLCASTMIEGKVTLKDVPRIQEVERILELIQSIGVRYVWIDEHTLELDSSGKLDMEKIDKAACRRTRSSLLLLGALAARVKTFKLYKSGGCKLGQRTVRPHTYALEKFGVQVESKRYYYDVHNKPLVAADIVMYESGDTPTENAVLAAVFASGTTTIHFASANYMVQDLCCFLKHLGARIEGIGTTTLTITGVTQLKSGQTYHIMPDPIDAMAWIAVAATTKSSLTIKNAPLDFLRLEMEKLKVMGQTFTLSKARKSKNGHFDIVDITMKPSSLTALPDKLSCRPYPGLNIDNLPLFIPILTQAKGRTLVHDWVYDNRAIYALELQQLGGNVTLVDTHRIYVEGVSRLQANDLMCPPALRPAMTVLICMLAANGTSILRDPYQIERGYERVVERLRAVGADIERIDD
ncbi:MAG: UDP-N-acetylglucosamine 1-carboxyvinyltransferase [Candidatus Magasanikbacteria bacterium CG10_big_fil_rev_8_21_14_0_10_47_10]|uniref:UDP-N-acetylglucosamine 1-carboxyvinyltransferase n=1 Tax=Candidatus Magasanikbacteria bacterium CG10_big_fil_rev_8_21_14_0_10_47_10 TaxID=1974652 RepID=A0A2H0TRG1_9BACT|nr:MAG: UDP-N-acetylglucosamine 1-carboxyvinyltransferase [Candidatus Magasanikbacteria bacterium CG10_big_fil_rev_8_21_14_0_10_47_10]